MSAVAKAYEELAGALGEGGITVKDYVPEKITPPLVIIASGDRFLEPSSTMNPLEANLNAELWLFTKPATNKVALESLLTLLETTLTALSETDWLYTTVSAPTMYSYNQNQYLSIRVEVNSIIEIGVDS